MTTPAVVSPTQQAAESNPPCDIPDNQAFVVYTATDGSHSVKPPPDTIAIPWPYLASVITVTAGALGAVSAVAVVMLARRSSVSVIRDL